MGFISHKAEDTYLLTTKLYCGKCGALMFGESGVSHTGKMYTYYKCAAAKKKKTCDKKAVRKQWLEDLVVNETMKLVEDDASMNAIIAKVMELQNQESTDLPIYEKQLKETETGITNMLNAIQMGILTSSTKERLEALEEQRKELQARIAEERLAKPKMKEEFVRFWLLRFRKLDMTQPEQRQALVDTFVNSIYLYDDKVLITFNYKEGTETVAFGEAVKAEKSSDMSAGGAPDFERQIVRFGVLPLCRKAAAHFLHTVYTFARIRGFSAQDAHSLLSLKDDAGELRVGILPLRELLAGEHRLHRQAVGQPQQHPVVKVSSARRFMLMGLYHNFSGKLVGKMQQNATLSSPFSATSSRQEMEGADPPGSDAGHKAFWRTEKVHRSCDPEGSDRSAAADGGKRAFCPVPGAFLCPGGSVF